MLVFCDLLQLSIPILRDPRWSRGAVSAESHDAGYIAVNDDSDHDWDIDESRIASITGFGLSARDVQIAPSGQISVSQLGFHWESLPSSYSGIAVRVCRRHHGRGNGDSASPRVTVRCSPAKVLQGHNLIADVYSVADAAEIILSRVLFALPEIAQLLDLERTLVDEIHVTSGLLCQSPVQVQQIIERMRSFRYRQWRAADTAQGDLSRGLAGYKTSLYFGAGSSYHRECMYHKGPEVADQAREARRAADRDPENVLLRERAELLERPEIVADAAKTLRLEGRWLRRGLTDFLAQLGYEWDGSFRELAAIEAEMADCGVGPAQTLFSRLWAKSWRPLIDQLNLGDPDMDLTDLEGVIARLHDTFDTYDCRGRRRTATANRAKNFLMTCMSYGWTTANSPGLGGYPASTVSRAVRDLEVVGISRAQLQDLDGTAQSRRDAAVVVSMRRVIEVAPVTALPDWFKSVDREASLARMASVEKARIESLRGRRVSGSDLVFPGADAADDVQCAAQIEEARRLDAELVADFSSFLTTRDPSSDAVPAYGTPITPIPPERIAADWARVARDPVVRAPVVRDLFAAI